MTTSATRKEIFQDILDNPGDDLPRLAFADLLLEHDSPVERARGEFIQLQIEAFHCSDTARHDACESGSGCRWCFFKRRWRELARLYGGWWRQYDYLDQVIWNDPDDTSYVFDILYERGFVRRVTGALDSWMENGDVIVARNPVQEVEISCRRPHRSSSHTSEGRHFWIFYENWQFASQVDRLPMALTGWPGWKPTLDERGNLTVGFNGLSDALAGLNEAALWHARNVRDLRKSRET